MDGSGGCEETYQGEYDHPQFLRKCSWVGELGLLAVRHGRGWGWRNVVVVRGAQHWRFLQKKTDAQSQSRLSGHDVEEART